MAIPTAITAEHIRKAMNEIKNSRFPKRHRSKKYCLDADGRHFPSKYTIMKACGFATGHYLGSNDLSGGDETKRFLRSLGFTVVNCSCGGGKYHD